jgi:tetratricopeptide (TPR) repeat protein
VQSPNPNPPEPSATESPSVAKRATPGIQPLAVCLLLVVITLGVYWSVTTHGFVDYDDGDYVTGNKSVQAGLNWAGVKWAFTTGHASNWHPLTWLSHMLDVSLFGQRAGGHHLTSLLFHCANTALVFLVLRAFTGAGWRSLCVAGLFALHPLHVESVAWISERKDVLSAFFGLLTLLWYARFAKFRVPSSEFRVGARASYGLALVCFALGLLCKPMLVTLPFVMLLLDWWPLGRVSGAECQVPASEDTQPATGNTLLRLVWEKLPFFALCLASSVVTFLVQRKGGAVSPLESLPIPERVANALVSYARYLGKTFWPDNLSVLYPHPGHWLAWQVGGAIVLLLGLTAGAVLARKQMPFVFVGWFWFVGMLVPVIGLVQVGIQSMADRYTYLPQLGIFVALAWSVGALVERWPKLRMICGVSTTLVVGACALLTAMQVGIWASSETLFRHAVRTTENNYLAYNNLGFYLTGKGRVDEAMTNYEASLAINPSYADARNNLGHALAERKKFAEAIVHYRAGLRSSPENVEIHNNLGNALAETGDTDGAMVEYRFVLQRNPEHADAHNNLGIALAMKGELSEAIEHFHQALYAKPSDAGAHSNLGNALAAQRKFAEAILHYREALKLSPNDAQARNNLGNVLAEEGRLAEAVTNYTEALRLKADNPEAHFNLGCVLVRLGQRDGAAEHFRAALQLNPDYEAAKEQLRVLISAPRP